MKNKKKKLDHYDWGLIGVAVLMVAMYFAYMIIAGLHFVPLMQQQENLETGISQ